MDTSSQPRNSILIISALAAIFLQLVVAPVITIFGVVPNFVLVVVIITAMNNTPVRSTIMGFSLGLAFDFCSLGPFGAMALVMTILGYAVSSLSKSVLSGGLMVEAIILPGAIILGEFLVSVIYAVVGVNPEFLFSLVQRVLPAIAYDAVIGFIILILYNYIGGGNSSRSNRSTGRPLNRKLHM